MTSNPNDTADYTPIPPAEKPPRPQPVVERTLVDIAALTHPGNLRSKNEDVYIAVRACRRLQTLWTNLPPGSVPAEEGEAVYGMLVADGVGGLLAGEVASQMAASTLIRLVLDTPDWILKILEDEGDRVLERMASRYREVDAVLKDEAEAHPELSGMSTTMTVCGVVGRDLFLGHVGDSRAYLYRGNDLHQLTRDHTLTQELVNMGVLQPERAATHHLRHVLTRALGERGRPVKPDVQHARLSDGDQILLCTDGLTQMVDDATIADTLRASATADEACHALVDLALKNGGKDNVTVALSRFRFVRDNAVDCP